MNDDCIYCARDQRLDDLMIKVCELKVSTLYLFKEQTYRGRCVVAFNKHVNELFELPEQELTLFMQDVTKAARAIKKTFSADKINYGIYSDKLPHLHFHLVPKHREGHSWGSTFEMMPSDKLLLSEAEYAAMVDLIKANFRDEA